MVTYLFLLIVLLPATNIKTNNYPNINMAAKKIISVDFEVFGTVQGVFFRKCTQEEANRLGVTGWCMNTSKGTVQGCIQGEPSKIDEMKSWLKNKGSPQSKIDKVEFSEEKALNTLIFNKFTIKR